MAIKNRLESLLKQQEELAAKITVEQRKHKGKTRKEETREKILVGAAVIADAAQNPGTLGGLVEVLKRGITTDRDRDFLKHRGWEL